MREWEPTQAKILELLREAALLIFGTGLAK
jgi:hypothetical protein